MKARKDNMARHCRTFHDCWPTYLQVDTRPDKPYRPDWHWRMMNPQPVNQVVNNSDNSSSSSNDSHSENEEIQDAEEHEQNESEQDDMEVQS